MLLQFICSMFALSSAATGLVAEQLLGWPASYWPALLATSCCFVALAMLGQVGMDGGDGWMRGRGRARAGTCLRILLWQHVGGTAPGLIRRLACAAGRPAVLQHLPQ
jgi:hypothetical protein